MIYIRSFVSCHIQIPYYMPDVSTRSSLIRYRFSCHHYAWMLQRTSTLLDILCLTETWLNDNDTAVIEELIPETHTTSSCIMVLCTVSAHTRLIFIRTVCSYVIETSAMVALQNRQPIKYAAPCDI